MCRDAILSINKVFLWYCFWISPVRRENHFAICFATNWKYAHVFAHIPFLCLAPGNISAIFSRTTLLIYQMKDCGHIYSLKVYLSYKKKIQTFASCGNITLWLENESYSSSYWLKAYTLLNTCHDSGRSLWGAGLLLVSKLKPVHISL